MIRRFHRAVFFCALGGMAASAGASTAPGDARERLSRVKDADYSSDAVVVLDETVVTVRPNGIGESATRRLVKVLKDGAIRAQSVQRFDFDPTTNTMELKAVRVHRADGRTDEVPVSFAVEQPEPQWGIYWGSRSLLVSVPRLEIGDAVETEAVKTGFNVAYLSGGGEGASGGGAEGPSLEPPMPGHWYDEVSFWSGLPVIEQRYVVRMPKDKPLQYEVYNGEVRTSVRFEGEHVVYTFEKRDIPAYHGEAHAVSPRDTQCKLVLATLADWPSKSRWFYEKNEPSFVVDDDIRAKVREVTASCGSDEEKITALNHWVAENIRYVGTSRGACEGYTTHAVRETFRDRGGVCKDKAGLLVAMLREAAFDSYIVMTQAGTEVAPVPADQFNHAVTCIRAADGSFRLLDPTWMPKSRENWSSAEQLQFVVYGTPQGEELTRSPYSGPAENRVTFRASSIIGDDGRLSGSATVTAEGAPETALRRALAGQRPEKRADWFAAAFARLSPVALVSDLQCMDPVDFSAPMQFACRYAADHYALGVDGRRFAALPMLRGVLHDVMLSDLPDTGALDKRRTAVRLRSTRRLEVEERVALPGGWEAEEWAEFAPIDGPAASLSFRLEKSAGALRYVLQMEWKKHRVPAEECDNLKRVLEGLRELSRRFLVFRVETSSARL